MAAPDVGFVTLAELRFLVSSPLYLVHVHGRTRPGVRDQKEVSDGGIPAHVPHRSLSRQRHIPRSSRRSSPEPPV